MADERTAMATYLGLSVAAIVFALAFVYPAYADQALPWYYPLERRWAWELRPDGLAMEFYGRTFLALVLSAPAGLIAYAIGRRVGRLPPRAADLLTAWVVTLTLLAMLFYAWELYSRRPVPEPLPPWYVPR